MRYEFRSLISLLVGLGVLAGLCIWVDPYLGYDSPVFALLIDISIPFLMMGVLWGLTGRPIPSLLFPLLIVVLATVVDYFKWRYLHVNLVYADLKIAPALLLDPKLILGFVNLSLWLLALAVAAAVAAIAALFLIRLGRCGAWVLRLPVLVMAAVGLVLLLGGDGPMAVPSIGWDAYIQPYGASKAGVMGNLLLSGRVTGDVRTPVDAHAVEQFRQAPEVVRAIAAAKNAASTQHPDIVIVQSESLFDASMLCGMPDKTLLPNIVGGIEPAAKLNVPVFGGGTLQTEFEVLTGTPIGFFRGSVFSYYELVDQPMDALPRQLDRLGYRTLVMHPNTRGFWRRDYVMPEFGFAAFVDKSAFVPVDYSPRARATDSALMSAVVSELDASSQPTFVFAITLDNHGPWGGDSKDAPLPWLPGSLGKTARSQLSDYVSRSIAADQSWGQLIEQLAKRKRPTIAVIYGDHLPGLAAVYGDLCFKDGLGPTEHHPPVRVWANFPIPPMPSEMNSYLLGGWVARAAHLSGDGALQNHMAAASIAHDASISASRRKALLEDYANVAARNVYARASTSGKPLLHYVAGPIGQGYLSSHVAKVPGARPLKTRNNAIVLLDEGQHQSDVHLALNGQVGRTTVRLYVPKGGSDVRVHVSGDDRTLLDAVVGRTSVEVATLDLAGVASLKIESTAMDDSGQGALMLKVAQMQCYDQQCARAPALPPGIRPVEVLAQGKTSSNLAANVDYLFAHESGRKDGGAPIARLPSDNGGIFMHSAVGYDAWLEFDASDLASLTIEPRVLPMDKACQAIPGAGTVDFSIVVDGTTLKRERVTPAYDKELNFSFHKNESVRLVVSSAGDTSCDWFYVRIPSLTVDSRQASKH